VITLGDILRRSSVCCSSALDEDPVPLLRRLTAWLISIKGCVGHQTQAVSLGHFVAGLLGESRRRATQAMPERVTDPPDCDTLQHFIAHAPWSTART
jgi:hypothetical protein